MKSMIATAASVALALGIACAQPSMDITDEHLMLQTGMDRADIHQKLQYKARRSCRRDGEFGVEPKRYETECRTELLDMAVTELNDDILTAVHEGHLEMRLAAH